MSEIRIDALLPAEMAERAEYLGVRKAEMPFLRMFMLAVLAGAFIALGAVFSTTVGAGSLTLSGEGGNSYVGALPYGMMRLLAGVVFSLGLILVVVGGAELFTGNNLIVMAWASGKVSLAALLRNWIIVYLGNFVGSVGTAVLVFLARQYTFGGDAIGKAALATAAGKSSLEFVQAFALGVLCNALVCLAVWMTYSARSTTDRIMAIVFPIAAFVAAGFEHSVANMYFIPYGLLIKTFDPVFMGRVQDGLLASKVPLAQLTVYGFVVQNLIPVTVGNIVGGAGLVAAVYWVIFLRKKGSD